MRSRLGRARHPRGTWGAAAHSVGVGHICRHERRPTSSRCSRRPSPPTTAALPDPGDGPAPGEEGRRARSAAQRYVAHLRGDHASALAQVGGADEVLRLHVSFNGFAAELTDAQAAEAREGCPACRGLARTRCSPARHVVDAALPRPRRRARALGRLRRPVERRRGRRHRRHRHRHLARAPELLGPDRHARRVRAGKLAYGPAPGAGRQLPDRRAVHRVDRATTS